MAGDVARRQEPVINEIHTELEPRQSGKISGCLLRVLQVKLSRPLTLYDSWWVFTATACAAWAVLGLVIWVSAHLHPNHALYMGALFVHLASLVLGFGAVLVADFFVLLWLTRRCPLAETVHVSGRLHLPIWLGVIGLVLSGMLLEPNLVATATQVKLSLVAVLTLNGLQAFVLSKRMESSTGTLSMRLLAWGTTTTIISQVCWWGSVWIGFWNATHRV